MPGWSMLDKDPHSRAVLGRHEYGGPAPPSSPIRCSEESPPGDTPCAQGACLRKIHAALDTLC